MNTDSYASKTFYSEAAKTIAGGAKAAAGVVGKVTGLENLVGYLETRGMQRLASARGPKYSSVQWELPRIKELHGNATISRFFSYACLLGGAWSCDGSLDLASAGWSAGVLSWTALSLVIGREAKNCENDLFGRFLDQEDIAAVGQ